MTRLVVTVSCLLSMLLMGCSGGSAISPGVITGPDALPGTTSAMPDGAGFDGVKTTSTVAWPAPPGGPGSGTPPRACDPMNDSELAREIAAIRNQLETLTAKATAIDERLVTESMVRKIAQMTVDTNWDQLVAYDTQLALFKAGKVLTHPSVTYGPREPILATWIAATAALRRTDELIDRLLTELADLNRLIAALEARLRQLEADLFELCHDQPAPPAMTH